MPPVSFASVDTTKMELTPVRVMFQGPSDLAPSDVGGTLGNVTITAKYGKAELKADQFGDTVLDRRVNSIVLQVTTEFTQIQKKDLFRIIFPHGSKIDGTGGYSGQDAFDWNSAIGDGDLVNSGLLILHPLSKPDTDKTTDWAFYKACAAAESEFVYGPNDQVRAKVVWNIMPDTSVTPPRFARYGDKDLT
jgi:hypothetical protein